MANKNEKCFYPTLQHKLRASLIVGVIILVAIVVLSIVVVGAVSIDGYMKSSGASDTVSNVANVIGTAMIENITLIVAVISVLLIVLAYCWASNGSKMNGYSLVVYTLFGVALYLYVRILFWAHILIITGGSGVGEVIIHDTLGGYTWLGSFILWFCIFFGVVSPILESIKKCFK